MSKDFFNYGPGDQVVDVTVYPPQHGIVVRKHEKPDTYYVRLNEAVNDVVVHARNLRMPAA